MGIPSKNQRNIVRLGSKLTNCEGCESSRKQFVVNDPESGIFPRGLFVWPSWADLDQVDIVLLGLNPGNSPRLEQLLYLKILNDSRTNYEELLKASADALSKDSMYWIRGLLLSKLLWSIEAHHTNEPTVLGAELFYCEFPASGQSGENLAKGKAKLPLGKDLRQVINTCSSKHLIPQLRQVPDSAIVICNGNEARNSYQRLVKETENLGHRRWCYIDHLTGCWSSWKSLYDGSKLRETTVENWKRVLKSKPGVIEENCVIKLSE